MMSSSSLRDAADWERAAARAIAAAGIRTSPEAAARAGRTLARLVQAHAAGAAPVPTTRAVSARAGAGQRAAFIAALVALAGD